MSKCGRRCTYKAQRAGFRHLLPSSTPIYKARHLTHSTCSHFVHAAARYELCHPHRPGPTSDRVGCGVLELNILLKYSDAARICGSVGKDCDQFVSLPLAGFVTSACQLLLHRCIHPRTHSAVSRRARRAKVESTYLFVANPGTLSCSQHRSCRHTCFGTMPSYMLDTASPWSTKFGRVQLPPTE